MSLYGIFSIARKEIRSQFLSPVALIFFFIFLAVNLFLFFTQSRFFIRGIADVRPLFEWMPLLLVFLLGVISMRAWADENRMGSIELLMTLPIRTYELVVGKFLAGMVLVVIALSLTLPIVYTVHTLGPIDMGPVWGGYIAALLLASSYLAIGLCLSALTDNQIVALLFSSLIGGLFYFVGTDIVAGFGNQQTSELLALLGTGSRFASIERGVVDFRDLFYYLSITAFFLSLNIFAIEKRRIELNPSHGISKWSKLKFTTVLLLLNLIIANVLIHQLRPGRIDLTQDRLYSVSDTTVDILNALDERVEITGFFSERTHPLLAPLVPQIKDLLEEYQARGKDKIKVQFLDPHKNEELEKEIAQSYDINSIPISVADRSEMAFVNAYFHVLVKYGNEYQVLDFQRLVDIKRDHSNDGVELRLRSLEYDITKAIKAVSKDFQSLEALMALHPIKITAYLTSAEKLPTQLKELHTNLKSVFEDLQKKAQSQKGELTYSFQDPALFNQNELQNLAQMGFMPIQSMDGQVFYLYGTVELANRVEPLFFLQQDTAKENLMRLVENAIRKSSPGFKKTIGLFTKSELPTDHPQMPFGQPPPQPRTDYNELIQILESNFIVKKLDLAQEMVPSDVDILLIAKTGELSENQRLAIDQFLMKGNQVIVFANHDEIEPEAVPGARGQVPPTFKIKSLNQDLIDVLKGYGVKIEPGWVADMRNMDIVYPTQAFGRIQIAQTDYPYFASIPRTDFSKENHPALKGLNSLTMLWSAPMSLDPAKINEKSALNAEVLLESSEESWISTDASLSPTVSPGASQFKKYPLMYAIQGRFDSLFKDSKIDETAKESLKNKLIKEGTLLNQSASQARLLVVSSAELLSDLGIGVGRYYGSLFGLKGDYDSAPLLMQNLVEWMLEDESLIDIRTAGASSRIIKTLKAEEQSKLELYNYAAALVLLGLLALIAILPRKLAKFED